jgi:hypothetical protein
MTSQESHKFPYWLYKTDKERGFLSTPPIAVV